VHRHHLDYSLTTTQHMLNFAKLTLIGLLSISIVVMASGNKDGMSYYPTLAETTSAEGGKLKLSNRFIPEIHFGGG
jgi:hypothetical protein